MVYQSLLRKNNRLRIDKWKIFPTSSYSTDTYCSCKANCSITAAVTAANHTN